MAKKKFGGKGPRMGGLRAPAPAGAGIGGPPPVPALPDDGALTGGSMAGPAAGGMPPGPMGMKKGGEVGGKAHDKKVIGVAKHYKSGGEAHSDEAADKKLFNKMFKEHGMSKGGAVGCARGGEVKAKGAGIAKRGFSYRVI